MTKRMILMLLGCLLVFGAVFGLKAFFTKMMNEGMKNAPIPTQTITATQAKRDAWAQALTALGTFRAVNGVVLASEVEGTISAIHFESGQDVSRGDVLVEVESAADRALLKSLQAAMRLAEQDYQRYRELFKKGSLSKSDLDRKESERDQAIANVEAQRERIAKKTIRAPFDGRLGIRHVDRGQFVGLGTEIVGVYQMDPILLNFSLPESQLSIVHKGYTIEAMPTALPQAFRGTITAVEPAVSPTTRNVDFQAQLANPEGVLRPGMFSRVLIQLPQEEPVLVVPRTAISYATYGNSVFVINPAEANPDQLVVTRRIVKLGRTRGDFVAVLEGLEEGEQVVTSGLLKLNNGTPVQIDNSNALPATVAPTPDNS